jgi:hypothetical protein
MEAAPPLPQASTGPGGGATGASLPALAPGLLGCCCSVAGAAASRTEHTAPRRRTGPSSANGLSRMVQHATPPHWQWCNRVAGCQPGSPVGLAASAARCQQGTVARKLRSSSPADVVTQRKFNCSQQQVCWDGHTTKKGNIKQGGGRHRCRPEDIATTMQDDRRPPDAHVPMPLLHPLACLLLPEARPARGGGRRQRARASKAGGAATASPCGAANRERKIRQAPHVAWLILYTLSDRCCKRCKFHKPKAKSYRAKQIKISGSKHTGDCSAQQCTSLVDHRREGCSFLQPDRALRSLGASIVRAAVHETS